MSAESVTESARWQQKLTACESLSTEGNDGALPLPHDTIDTF